MDVLVFAVVSEVVQAEEMQVRRVVPFVGERCGDGDISFEEYVGSGFVVAKFGKPTIAFFPTLKASFRAKSGFFTC